MKLVLDFLLIAGLLLTAIVLTLLFARKARALSHTVLIIIFSSIFLLFLSYYAYLHRITYLLYATFIFSNSIDVYIGPLFLLYVQSIRGSLHWSFKAVFPHFIFPLVYGLVVTFPVLFGLLFDSFEPRYIDHLYPYILFTNLYSIGYCAFALIALTRFQKLMKHQYSSLDHKNLDWMKRLLFGVLGIMCLNLGTSVYETVRGDQGWDIDFITVIPIVFLVAYMGYYGLSQSTILLPDFMKSNVGDDLKGNALHSGTNVDTYRYDPTDMQQLANRLRESMESEKPYLEEDLTLTQLAQTLGVPDKKLSTVLNQNLQTSFYDFINGHRVAEVKRKISLPDGEKYTLLAIGYDCGFKSKSSFNRVFKKIAGLSPSEYRKKTSLD